MADGSVVIVLGGCGFIGRHMVAYLLQNDLASKVVVADKVLPATAYLDEEHAGIFESDAVEYVQCNLAREASIAKVFDAAGGDVDVVINLAGETKYSQPESAYQEKIVDVATKCAAAAKEAGVRRFIEVSTAQVYDSDKKPKNEEGKIKPWTKIAEHKLQAEQALLAMDGIEVVVVRPAIVYGPGDVQGIMPRVICAAVYQRLDEKMQFLWAKDLRLNTVHVRDVVRALWHLSSEGTPGEIYNLADSGDTDQQTVNKLLEPIFGIKTGFVGALKSRAANLVLSSVAENTNDKHMPVWSDICSDAGIGLTPLTPYLDLELLSNNSTSVNGTKIEGTGFEYEYPAINEELIREQIAYVASQGIFPESVLQ